MDMRAAVRALRDQEDAGGAVTANARMMAQVLRNRQAYERNQAQGGSGALEYGANVLSAVPVIGDALGLARDVAMFRDEPETRTPTNIGLAALGLIPFVPPAVSYGLDKLAKARGVKTGPTPGSLAAALRGQRGAIVYHGSPHRFDRFDSSKIGTGEGAQAYGHGLYLAESPAVAISYRKADQPILTTGDSLNGMNPSHIAAAGMHMSGGNAKAVINELQWALDNPHLFPDEIKEVYTEAINLLKRNESLPSVQGNVGNLYTVDLPDPMISRMLDWDKPLSQQGAISSALTPQSMGLQYRQLPNGNHAFVNEAGKPVGILQRGGTQDGFAQNWMESVIGGSGRDVYNNLNNSLPSSASTVASVVLRQAGIPGIRYLDGMSRAAGEGTSNFVVFPGEESALRILKRE